MTRGEKPVEAERQYGSYLGAYWRRCATVFTHLRVKSLCAFAVRCWEVEELSLAAAEVLS